MEGVERAKVALDVPLWKRMLYRVCCCCFSKKFREKIFLNRFLLVRPAVEPELLLWPNFGVTSKARCFRILMFIFFVFVVLLVCFYSILLLENTVQKSEDSIPDIECQSDVPL